MIVTIPLQAGTQLANVAYRFIVAGQEQAQQTSGITQPDTNFPFFVFNVNPPAGTNEIIAYDVTNLANWNVAQYLLAIQAGTSTPSLPPVIAAARTIPFRTVYESIIRRIGYNPRGDQVKEDVAQNVLSHLNDQVRYGWGVWEWPDLNKIEWRAFRKVWTPTVQVNNGEDVYYLGDGVTVPAANVDLPSNWPGPNEGYYNCIATPPPGTLPTNLSYFNIYGGSVLTTQFLDRYIAFSQPNQNVIGDLLDIYDQNPREVNSTRIVRQGPSSKGIDVFGGLNVVWIRYRLPESVFTLTPFIPGYTTVGGSYYDPATGNCFISQAAATLPGGFPAAPNTASDILIPFPIFLKGFVQEMAYAEVLLDTSESKTKMQSVQVAVEKAERYLLREIDKLAEQGQRLYYPAFPSRRRHHGNLGNVNWDQGDIPFEQLVELTQQ